MTIDDDRTPEQLTTHTELIVARDKILSGWGRAKTGKSICAWACRPEHTRAVLEWVSNRSDMTNVRLCATNYKPRGQGHFQIYVVTENHPSLWVEGKAINTEDLELAEKLNEHINDLIWRNDNKTSAGPFAPFGSRS